LPVFCGSVSLSLAKRELQRLRVSDNRATRRIFGFKRREVKGDWIKLRNEEPRVSYSSPNKIILIKCKNVRVGEMHVWGEIGTGTRFW
jgi:hypothetical protein